MGDNTGPAPNSPAKSQGGRGRALRRLRALTAPYALGLSKEAAASDAQTRRYSRKEKVKRNQKEKGSMMSLFHGFRSGNSESPSGQVTTPESTVSTPGGGGAEAVSSSSSSPSIGLSQPRRVSGSSVFTTSSPLSLRSVDSSPTVVTRVSGPSRGRSGQGRSPVESRSLDSLVIGNPDGKGSGRGKSLGDWGAAVGKRKRVLSDDEVENDSDKVTKTLGSEERPRKVMRSTTRPTTSTPPKTPKHAKSHPLATIEKSWSGSTLDGGDFSAELRSKGQSATPSPTKSGKPSDSDPFTSTPASQGSPEIPLVSASPEKYEKSETQKRNLCWEAEVKEKDQEIKKLKSLVAERDEIIGKLKDTVNQLQIQDSY